MGAPGGPVSSQAGRCTKTPEPAPARQETGPPDRCDEAWNWLLTLTPPLYFRYTIHITISEEAHYVSMWSR